MDSGDVDLAVNSTAALRYSFAFSAGVLITGELSSFSRPTPNQQHLSEQPPEETEKQIFNCSLVNR